MADTGWVVAGTGVNVPVSGGQNWNSPNNITSETDASYAEAPISAATQPTALLRASNFGFSIPPGASIVGVEARIRLNAAGFATGDTGYDIGVKLLVGGSPVGDNKAFDQSWSTSVTSKDYGAAADLWGLAPTPANVNASDFGLEFQGNLLGKARMRMMTIWMRIHFEEGGGNVSQRVGGTWRAGQLSQRVAGVHRSGNLFQRVAGNWRS